MDEPKDYNNRWRFSKDIPISVVLFLIVQSAMGVWFFATQNKSIVDVVAAFKDFSATAYSKEDARHEREFNDQRFLYMAGKNDELTRRIALLEAQLLQVKR